MNVVTSFIDASVVYGSNEERLKEVRDKDGKGQWFGQWEGSVVYSSGKVSGLVNRKGQWFIHQEKSVV